MKQYLWLIVLNLVCLVGCAFNDGPCYRREDIDGPSGAGGGTIVPGQGGFGDAPPEPQNSDEPEPIACPTEQDDVTSCGDFDADTLGQGNTYAYCSDACASKCQNIGVGAFSPSVFNFMTTLPDDGTDKGGGWQVATATLKFARISGLLPESWSCTVTVGMPLRTALHGKVSAESAASISAAVATQASANVRKSEPELPPGVFCIKLIAQMDAIFRAEPLKSYGARATK
ncbi:MAG: hypothetical protein R3B70_07315 [Polyangiaceae bacterium]